jgi:hypothetical protein
VFMLIRREDLRNRFIRFVGHGRMTAATNALEDAAERISRYLLMQAIINSTYGVAVATGLYLIGLPYAALWGLVGAFLRFIPYVGPWIAALMPSALGLAVFEGWIWPLAVIALFVIVELFTNMVLETWLWGESAGVSEVALLISVAFWTWLWGPIGLLLATPLTVCLVVLGKYVPQLEFITILMTDEPVLEPSLVYYQRLLASDQNEAAHVVADYVNNHTQEKVYDEVLIPALNYARRDREEGSLNDAEEQFIFKATQEIISTLNHRQSPVEATEPSDTPAAENASEAPQVRILGCPARDQADEVALLMFQQLLRPTRYQIEVVPEEKLTSEVVSEVRETRTRLVCIGGIAPGGLAQSRHLCKRLRSQFPDIKIIVGLWGFRGKLENTSGSLLSAGADEVGTTLLQSRDQISSLSQLISNSQRTDT